MSLILMSLVGAAGLWHAQRQRQFEKYKADEKADKWAPGVAQRPFNSTGVYGDISEVSNMVNKPGFVVGERHDVDLTGVPCRWLIMRNGGVYKTYDTTTDYTGNK